MASSEGCEPGWGKHRTALQVKNPTRPLAIARGHPPHKGEGKGSAQPKKPFAKNHLQN
jgi:hypothetical protein